MLTEEQLEIYGGVLVPVFQQLEQDIIADIARRVRKEERWTETAELQAEELRREYRTLRAYTDGLEHALRHGMHVEVNVEGGGAYADRSTESTDG